jgi:hypothetical protein
VLLVGLLIEIESAAVLFLPAVSFPIALLPVWADMLASFAGPRK